MADEELYGNNGEVELEAKRRADGSWHPCQLSLREGNSVGLSLKLQGQDSEDVIVDVEDAFTRLRVRSVSLSEDDCCCIEGKQVLAARDQNSHRLFFDAVVQKVIKVRHSKRSCCRCSFIIQWISEGGESKSSTIPSGFIMKLAAESINSHPVVAAFLNSLQNSGFSTPSPSHTGLNETEVESDLYGWLEKQIEEIGSLVKSSKNEHLIDTLSRDCAERERQTRQKNSGRASKLRTEVTSRNNCVRRSGRNQNKVLNKMEDLVVSTPSSAEKFVEKKHHLNPLAARAMLASLVSKVPQKIETILGRDRNCVSVLDYTGQKSDIFENNEWPDDKIFHEKSSGPNVLTDTGGSIPSSISTDKSTQPSRSRLTRSTENSGVKSNGKVESRIMTKGMLSARVTRSAFREGTGDLSDGAEKPFKRVTPAIEKETRLLNGEETRSTLNVQEKYKILTNTKRTTRSAAREANGNLDDKVKEALESEPRTESTQSDPGEETDCVPEASVSTKKRVCPLVNTELELVERNQKQKRSDAVGKTQNTAAENQHSSLGNQFQNKSISLKNQQLRSSPRLRLLPRTQSQA